jgi:hypothetical protein
MEIRTPSNNLFFTAPLGALNPPDVRRQALGKIHKQKIKSETDGNEGTEK